MYLGAFSDTFGIRPWEWDRLEAGEVLSLVHYIDELERQADG